MTAWRGGRGDGARDGVDSGAGQRRGGGPCGKAEGVEAGGEAAERRRE